MGQNAESGFQPMCWGSLFLFPDVYIRQNPMPFPGIPAGSPLEAKIDRCVERVTATGRDKSSAIAICRSSIGGSGKRTKDRQEAVNQANYRNAGPASTQICQTCQFAEAGQCTIFNFRFDPEWTCNRWRPDIEASKRRQSELYEMSKKQQWIDEAKERIALREKASLSVFKDADGRHRWVMVSSSAYQDRDGEIVSLKALENAVAEHDRTGQRGELDWWHTNVILGDTDFGMLHGRMLLESGTFRDERIGAAVSRKAANLGGSLGFNHPKTEPINGVFENIRIFRRGLLPRERASNLFTSFKTYKESIMNEEKLKALTELLGDEALAKSMLAQAEQTDKAAQEAGFAYKSHDDLAKMSANDLLEYALQKKEYEEQQAQQQPDADAVTMKAIDERLDKILTVLEGHTAAIKELQEVHAEKAAEQQTQATGQFQKLDERLKALEDDQPRALARGNGHRASAAGPEDPEDEGKTEKDALKAQKEAMSNNPAIGPFADVAMKMSPVQHPYWGGPNNTNAGQVAGG